MSIVVGKCVVNVSAYVYTSHSEVSAYHLYLKFKKTKQSTLHLFAHFLFDNNSLLSSDNNSLLS